MEEFDVKTSLPNAGAYLATHAPRKFRVTPVKWGQLKNLNFKKITDIAYQIVYLGVIDPSESESVLSWAYSFPVILHIFS